MMRLLRLFVATVAAAIMLWRSFTKDYKFNLRLIFAATALDGLALGGDQLVCYEAVF